MKRNRSNYLVMVGKQPVAVCSNKLQVHSILMKMEGAESVSYHRLCYQLRVDDRAQFFLTTKTDRVRVEVWTLEINKDYGNYWKVGDKYRDRNEL